MTLHNGPTSRRWNLALYSALVFLFVALGGQLPAAETNTNRVMDEFTALARRFGRLAPSGGMQAEEAFDVRGLAARIQRQMPDQKSDSENIRAGAEAAFKTTMTLLQGTYLHLLRVRQQGGEYRALFRIIGQNDSLNYIECISEPSASQGVRFVDYYLMNTGQTSSEGLAKMFQNICLASPPLQRLFSKDTSESRAKATRELAALSDAGDHQAVLKKFQELPLEMQRQKTLLIRRANAAMSVSNEEFLAAIRFWRVNYPNDPAIDLLAMEGFLMQNKFDDSLAAVDRIDAAVGGDSMLDLVRANIHRKAGHVDLADTLKKRANAAERQWYVEQQEAEAESKARWKSFAEAVNGGQPPPLVPASVRQAARSNAAAQAQSAGTTPSVRRSATAKPGSMRLQGVFLRTGAPSAIISGHDVVEGDSVEGHKVVKIEASRVVMQNAQGEMFNLTYQ